MNTPIPADAMAEIARLNDLMGQAKTDADLIPLRQAFEAHWWKARKAVKTFTVKASAKAA